MPFWCGVSVLLGLHQSPACDRSAKMRLLVRLAGGLWVVPRTGPGPTEAQGPLSDSGPAPAQLKRRPKRIASARRLRSKSRSHVHVDCCQAADRSRIVLIVARHALDGSGSRAFRRPPASSRCFGPSFASFPGPLRAGPTQSSLTGPWSLRYDFAGHR
jgi:hypothetical protein